MAFALLRDCDILIAVRAPDALAVNPQMRLKDPANPANEEAYDEATLDWKQKITGESKRTIATLVCGDEFNVALTTVRNAIRMGMQSIAKKAIKNYDEIGPSVTPAMRGAIVAARKELGMPEDVTSQFTGS